jgi:hypothetical protein
MIRSAAGSRVAPQSAANLPHFRHTPLFNSGLIK